MKIKKKCAYCNREVEDITREHVVNKAFIDTFYKNGKGYLKAFDKYTDSYAVVRDVCTKCNNEVLGRLDAYFLKFYNHNLPRFIIDSETKIEINYDFEQLSKWLLKTLYNSERKNRREDDLVPLKMYRYKEYLTGKRKDNKLFKIYMELLRDVPLEEIQQHCENIPEDFTGKIDFLKVGTIVLKSEVSSMGLENITNVNKYLISSNFAFHIFLLDPGRHTEQIFKQRLSDFKNESRISILTLIDPKKNSIELKASSRDIIDYLNETYEGDLHYTERNKN